MNVEQTAGAAAQVAPTPQQRLTLWYILRRWPILPVSLLALLAIMGIGADWIAPNDPIDQSLPDRNARPLYQDGSPYFFGGDHVGRDVLRPSNTRSARFAVGDGGCVVCGDVDRMRARAVSGLCGGIY